MKILIIRFSSLGDIVLTSPVPRLIKKRFPSSEVHFLTKKNYSETYINNINISKLYLLDENFFQLYKELKKNNYDLIIDLHNNIRSFILRKLLGVKFLVYNKNRLKRWLIVNLKLKVKIPHIVDSYIKTLSSMNIKNDNKGLDYFLAKNDFKCLNLLPKLHRKSFISLVIGAKHKTKILPTKKLIELCDKINEPIVLIGGKSEIKSSIEIENYFKNSNKKSKELKLQLLLNKKTKIFNLVGKLSINQSASIIKISKKVYTHDTGMMHIAAALNKEIVSIWGSTHPTLGFYPYNSKFTVIQNDKIKCRPCSKIGHATCPIYNFRCMNELKLDI